MGMNEWTSGSPFKNAENPFKKCCFNYTTTRVHIKICVIYDYKLSVIIIICHIVPY